MTIHIAVIGTSMIADDFIEVIEANPQTTYVGSYSRNPERADKITQAHHGTRAFYSLQDIASCPDVNVVYIASPNVCHKEQALVCINAHKHVIIEKPFCACYKDAKEVFEAAERKGVIALEAMRPVHDPAYKAIIDVLDQIGPIRRATLRFGKYSSRYDELLACSQTNIFDCNMCSGALMDIGVYCISTMVMLFGTPKHITSVTTLLPQSTQALTHGPLDGCGSLLATYNNHLCEVAYSKISADLLPTQIEGERGTITIDALSCPSEVTLTLRGKAIRNAAKASERTLGDSISTVAVPHSLNTMEYELDDFCSMINGALSPSRYQTYTLETLAITDSIRAEAGIKFPCDRQIRKAS